MSPAIAPNSIPIRILLDSPIFFCAIVMTIPFAMLKAQKVMKRPVTEQRIEKFVTLVSEDTGTLQS
ncbi:MAG: hypothetical protein AAGU12_15895, partial [Clostridiales bacterium]